MARYRKIIHADGLQARYRQFAVQGADNPHSVVRVQRQVRIAGHEGLAVLAVTVSQEILAGLPAWREATYKRRFPAQRAIRS